MIAVVGLLFLLAGCGSAGAKKASAKTAIATTETSTVASSVAEKPSTTDSKASSETQTTISSETAAEITTKTTASTTTSNETTESSISDSSTSASSSQPEVHTLWNAPKASELAVFMSMWGQEMGQQYRSYNNSANANYYGMPVPQAILEGRWVTVIDQTPVSVEWTENGTGQADFQLAAVYSDIEDSKPGVKHLYFFGFQQNQPKVLVTQQNQGNVNNYLYFKETGNAELKNGFDQIVNS